MMRMVVACASALLLAGCTPEVKPAVTTTADESIGWRKVGSWSGRGNAQTESFIGETGIFRVHWETRDEDPAGNGVFRLTIHSAISGRPLVTAADQRGAGNGLFYVNEAPRTFHAMVESSRIGWSFQIEEGAEAAR